MSWSALSFLAEPWFVIPWYACGVLGAAWVAYDLSTTNTALKPAMKWAWPIIVLFFSVLGLGLYLGTARAPGIGDATTDEEKRQRHHRYERSMPRRVNGAVIHCVAGDGLGIMTAMVIARAFGFTFWQEFWFEYAVGFAFGWFIFQLRSTLMMTDSKLGALALAFRGEFFSMLSVMGGMGAVMTYVTPSVVGAQPGPLTYAFWGFGMLGLLVSYLLTLPTNFIMVKLGWKHGMGSMQDADPARGTPTRAALIAAMSAWCAAALVLPAWLTEAREGRPIVAPNGKEPSTFGEPSGPPIGVMKAALRTNLRTAADPETARAETTRALDGAMRAAEVGAKAAPTTTFEAVHEAIGRARRALQIGSVERMQHEIEAALREVEHIDPNAALQVPAPLQDYEGAPVLDARGRVIGELTGFHGDRAHVALGGLRDVWGFWDMRTDALVSLPVSSLVFGPARTIGKSYVMITTQDTCWRGGTLAAQGALDGADGLASWPGSLPPVASSRSARAIQ